MVLGAQEDWDSALSLYEQSIGAWAFCFEELKMYWIMPALLNAYVSRLSTLIILEQWQRVARDVARFVELYKTFVDNDAIEHGWKTAASEKFVEMINLVSALPVDKRDLLYAELGDATEAIRALALDEEKK